MVTKHGNTTSELLMAHAPELWQLPSTHTKTAKLQVFLPHLTHANLNDALLEEVKAAAKTPQSDLSLSTLTAILACNPSVDSNNAQALCIAISAANQTIVDALLECKPSPASLSTAFPCAIRLEDPAHRFTFTKRLIDAGAPKWDSTRALAYCVEHLTADITLITLLTNNADISDGIALGKAVKVESSVIVQLLIAKGGSTPTAVDQAFVQSMSASDRGQRLSIARILLGTKKVTADGVSAALVSAVDDVDPALVRLLIEAGAILEDCHSSGVIKASRMGCVDMLSLLLSGMKEPNKEMLESAFQAATGVADLKLRTAVLRTLLDKGVAGRVVDEQLVSASRYGDRGHEMLKMLLSRGANPNYMGGESVCAAVRSANLPNLDLLLGLGATKGKQVRPSTLPIYGYEGAAH
jgi:ankyrin repeat protein